MTSLRATHISKFLETAGWQTATRAAIPGDASSRRYERLRLPDGRIAMLMDAPPAQAGSMVPFVEVDRFLIGCGLSAPEIFASDLEQGLLLIEDFGDALFARQIANDPTLERPYYDAALETLIALHKSCPPDLPSYGVAEMVERASMGMLYYRNEPVKTLDDVGQAALDLLEDLLSNCMSFGTVALRDFHAENLIWLPEREGVKRVGLLDFQDAGLSHPAYDLVSLLKDARRDVPPDLANELLEEFAKRLGVDIDRFCAEAALISAQRNLRILGVFVRLSREMGKPRYVDLIPRVWNHLQNDLSHPTLAALKARLEPILPRPSAAFLEHLKTPCQT